MDDADLAGRVYEAQQRLNWFIDGYFTHCIPAFMWGKMSTDAICRMYNIPMQHFRPGIAGRAAPRVIKMKIQYGPIGVEKHIKDVVGRLYPAAGNRYLIAHPATADFEVTIFEGNGFTQRGQVFAKFTPGNTYQEGLRDVLSLNHHARQYFDGIGFGYVGDDLIENSLTLAVKFAFPA